MKYLLVDAHNLFNRSKHVTGGNLDIRVGMCIHIILSSMMKVYRQFDIDEVIIALEGRSWRKDYYKTYKLNRKVAANMRGDKEKEEDEVFIEYYNELIEFMRDQTNLRVLHHKEVEADDLIARWVQRHPNDQHIILSSDTDFRQLVADNVHIYNGITDSLEKPDGVWDDKGKPVLDKKTKQQKVYESDWELFLKCMLGDPGDGIMRAVAPRTRKTKIRDAFDDRHNRGFAWNNIMLEEWDDGEGVDTTLNRYERNCVLIDLSRQPEEIIQKMDDVIDNSQKTVPVKMVGIYFLKFCTKMNLERLKKSADSYAEMLS